MKTMNNLNKFVQKQLSPKEVTAIKGGIRLITADFNEALTQIQELNQDGVAYHVTKNYTTFEYCIEW